MGSSPTGPTIVMSQDIGMTPEPTLSGFGVLGFVGGSGALARLSLIT